MARRKALAPKATKPPPAPVVVTRAPASVRAAVDAHCLECLEVIPAGSLCGVVRGFLVHPRCIPR